MFLNIPKVRLGIVAVSRDCFPIELSQKRRAALVQAYRAQGGEIAEMQTTIENELDALKALAELKAAGRENDERCFTVQGTMADPRWLDPSVDPNGRKPNWCFLGDPRVVNDGVVGLARFTSLRSWLS